MQVRRKRPVKYLLPSRFDGPSFGVKKTTHGTNHEEG
jgi:hypothetical protein